MTPAVACDFAAAFGSFVLATAGGSDPPTLCLGRDTRSSSEMLSASAAAGLMAVGARVVDLGVTATPTLGVMVDELGAAGGLVITASHNPTQWNGLKCISAGGAAPPPADAHEILRRFRERDFILAAPRAFVPRAADDRSHRIHVERVLAQVDAESIRAARPRVVLDPNNGAGGTAGRQLLEALGCDVIAINDAPRGCFAHPPEPLEENLQQLARTTAAEGAHAGFGQDPDADRLAIVDERGRYLGEEYTVVLAARRLLESRGAVPMVVNLSTSRMIDDLARNHPGATVHRAAVGETNVVVEMKRRGAPVGGEGNGGVILPAVCWIRDSLSAMALVLELMVAARRLLESRGAVPMVVNLSTSRMIDDLARNHPGATVHRAAVGEANVVVEMKHRGAAVGGEGNGGVILPAVCWIRDSLSAMALVLELMVAAQRPLSALVDEMPRYEMIKDKLDLPEGYDAADGAERVARHFSGENISTTDGIRVDLEDGWVHLRPSNTEPIIRVIAESPTRSRTRELINQTAQAAGLRT